MYLNRQVRDIPDGDPVVGASMQITRATDSVSVGSAVTDADGFATLTANGSPGPIKARFLKGSTIWSDDSRSLMAVGSHSLAELRDLINYTHTDGYLPWGNQFSATTGIGTFTVSTGAVVLDGVVAIHWSASTVATTDGDIAIVIRQANADGRTELAAIAYADIGSTTCVPLWRCTVTSGSASNVTWIGVRTLRGVNTYGPCQSSVVRVASGSTTSASGEASSLTTTITLDTGVHYQVTARGSFIARARDGAIAISINGNLSTYRTNSGDTTVQLRNSHVRDVTGAGACVVTVYHRSDTALTDWVQQAGSPFGIFGSGLGATPNFDRPQQVATDTSGNVYVADYNNGRVLKLNSSGIHIDGVAGLPKITGVCLDPSNNIYVAYYAAVGGAPLGTRVAKYSSAFVQQYDLPVVTAFSGHIATDGTYLYLSVFGSNIILKRVLSTMVGVKVWGSFGTGNGQFNGPWGIATDGTYVYVVDRGNDRVQKFTTAGVYVTQWGTSGSGAGQLADPIACAIDGSGNIWVADYGNSRLSRYSGIGTYQTTIAQSGCNGIGIATGDILWVSNYDSHNVSKWDETAAAFSWDSGLLHAQAVPRS